MNTIEIKKGLDLPITGKPLSVLSTGNKVRRVALLGPDYTGMKPKFEVEITDRVKTGQTLFTDKKNPLVRYTSPAAGKIAAINRGEKRRFLSIVIELDGDEEMTFSGYSKDKLQKLDRQSVVSQLVQSGLWTAIRSRPFGKVPNPESIPHSLFVTAMDTNPLAPDIETILQGQEDHFVHGLGVISKLTNNHIYVCKSPTTKIPPVKIDSLSIETFQGPHPAGLAGTHIHFLDPVYRDKTVWTIGLQDVIGIGHLFTTGRLITERIVSLAGSGVKNPRLIRTRIGASIFDLVENELKSGEYRVISGSVFLGHIAKDDLDFLGRYHQQISVIPEIRERRFMGWLDPGLHLYSVKNIVLSKLVPKKKFNFTTETHGGKRTILPVGSYEKVMPLDILPTYLLRALAARDIEEAEKLGCLELTEEDLALCTFVCPSKINHGENLREVLDLIEKELV